MTASRTKEAAILAVGLIAGLALLGLLLGTSAVKVKEFERTVAVKGLAEREVQADVALWPITFTGADNDLGTLYADMAANTALVTDFLAERSFTAAEITVSPPAVSDKLAQQWSGNGDVGLRYTATQTVTVYTGRVDAVRTAIGDLAELGRAGLVISGDQYQSRIQFIFTGLNDVKPAMVEEATRNARIVAAKFAEDSQSTLGKIKTARQGQFSITDRDANTPHIKNVRVVATVEYYLAD